MYLTARSYLLAGFTAASIVAAIPLAPRPTIHLPSIHSPDIRLEAAESEIASKVHKLRAVEARTLAAVVHRTTGTVVDHPGTAQQAPTTTTVAGTITPSDLAPLIGDLAAFDFDLLGTPFGIVTALSFAGDLALSDLGSGLLQDIPGDVGNSLGFGIASQLNLLTADINVLTNEINHLAAIVGPTAPSGTQGSGDTATAGTSTSVAGAAPLRTSAGTFDPTAIGSLVGDAATLGLDVAATPFQLVDSLTSALSGAASDLGAGQFQDAKQDFTSRLQLGFALAEERLSNDLDGIGTALAQLTGASNTTVDHADTANSPAAEEPRLTDIGRRPPGFQPTASALTAKPAGATDQGTAAHEPRAIGIAATPPSTASRRPPSDEPGTAKDPIAHRGDTASNAKPPSASPAAAAGGHANVASPAGHSAPGKSHTAGPKHGKH